MFGELESPYGVLQSMSAFCSVHWTLSPPTCSMRVLAGGPDHAFTTVKNSNIFRRQIVPVRSRPNSNRLICIGDQSTFNGHAREFL